MLELILMCALLAFLELDTTYFGQFLLSRPIVVGSIAGYLTGDLFLGIQLGIFTELIYLDFIPVGGIVPPSGAVSVSVAVLMAHYFKMDIYFAFFTGIVCGIFFSIIEKQIRKLRTRLLPIVEREIVENKRSAGSFIIESLTFEYLAVFAFLLVATTMLGPAFSLINFYIPEKLHIAFKFSYFVVPWVGFAILFISFSSKPKAE